jgi:hypothetical protein
MPFPSSSTLLHLTSHSLRFNGLMDEMTKTEMRSEHNKHKNETRTWILKSPRRYRSGIRPVDCWQLTEFKLTPGENTS